MKKFEKAFTLHEIIFSLLILIIVSNFCYIKYIDFRDNYNIKIAKNAINEVFFLSSNLSLKNKTSYIVEFDNYTAELTLFQKGRKELIKNYKLSDKLSYITTDTNQSRYIRREFTADGNIAKSFSVYICDSRHIVKYRISFYGFDISKFLQLNNYKKVAGEKVKRDAIYRYHNVISNDRELFEKEWKKEP